MPVWPLPPASVVIHGSGPIGIGRLLRLGSGEGGTAILQAITRCPT